MPKFVRELTHRQILAMAVASGVLLLAMVILSLAMATRTALLNRDLELLDVKQALLNQENNRLWREIGEISSAQAMDQRIRAAGFEPPEQVEFMQAAPDAAPEAGAPLTATVPLTGTPGGSGQ